LHEKGLSVSEIASQIGVSYSCVYHWVRGLRKPSSGKLNEFEDFIRRDGPASVMDIKARFPKHNELFLTASRRGLPIKRYRMSRRLGDYSTWYFIEGQETELKERIKELLGKYKELKEKLIDLIGG
jgi:transcriptional regulator with XRE-family HTH domain